MAVLTLYASGCSHNEDAPSAAPVDVNAAASQAQSMIDNYLASRGPSVDRVARKGLAPQPSAAISRYASLLDHGRYGEAWRMWRGDGFASGLTERDFALRYARLSRLRIEADRATANMRGDVMVVRVILRGTLASGRGLTTNGTISLQRDRAGMWRIVAATI